jgi:sigma-B regulation protein RsbU (phosphoserine phosphatase)
MLYEELSERRGRLERAASWSEEGQLVELLDAVDVALRSLEDGSYGVCQECDGAIEPDRLAEDPLTRICLECLSPTERRALEQDLTLASEIQTELLPDRDFDTQGWQGHYVYQPHSSVSGDYVDVVHNGQETIVLVGDVAGKGVAAALLMSHLNAIFRGLVGTDLPLNKMLEQANRMFCAAIPDASFATLVAARLKCDGSVEISNAGHVPPLCQNGRVTRLPSNGVPLGLFCEVGYSSQTVRLEPGDRLVLATDGVIESRDLQDVEYGIDALAELVAASVHDSPRKLISRVLEDVERFRAGSPTVDDTTVMVVQRKNEFNEDLG